MVTGCITDFGNDLPMAVVVSCRWNLGVQKVNSLKIENKSYLTALSVLEILMLWKGLFSSARFTSGCFLSLGPSAQLFLFRGLHIGLYFVKYLRCSRVFLLLEKAARQILQSLLRNRSLYVCECRDWIGSVRANESSLVKGDSWIGNSLHSKDYKIARLFMRSLLRPVPPLQESCIKNGTIMTNDSFLMVA